MTRRCIVSVPGQHHAWHVEAFADDDLIAALRRDGIDVEVAKPVGVAAALQISAAVFVLGVIAGVVLGALR